MMSEMVPVAFITPAMSMMSMNTRAAPPVTTFAVHPAAHPAVARALVDWRAAVRAGSVPARPIVTIVFAVVTVPLDWIP